MNRMTGNDLSKCIQTTAVALLLALSAGLPAASGRLSAAEGADVILVEDHRPRAVIVIPDDPSRVSAYAAEELAFHVKEAAGVELPVVPESRVSQDYPARVFLGATREAAKRELRTDHLENDACILRTIGNDLFILGKEEKSAPPLSPNHAYSGTLFGVYEILNRDLGVRWLWPGKLGTYVPRAATIKIRAANEVVAPRLLLREISYYNYFYRFGFIFGEENKPGPYPSPSRNLAFSTQEKAARYVKDYEMFIRRHRLGRSQPLKEEEEYLRRNQLDLVNMESVYRLPRPMHAFHGWWQQFGKTHPEWFAMREDGGRGPKSPNPSDPFQGAAMCVSNPDLHRYLVDEVMTPGRVFKVGPRTIWDGRAILDLSEADAAGKELCQCPNCLAWDGPQEENPPDFVREKSEGRMMSNRYARFWKTVYDLAVKRCPEVKVLAYIYHNYYQAPSIDIKLSPNIIGEVVLYGVAGYYPMTKEEDRWNRAQWLGWKKTGMTLLLRPNYLLTGYVMPEITTRQIADFLKFAYKNGMVGLGYEGRGGFPWAAQGPMAYMHYRLLWNPELDYDAIRREYYSAFGPAASLVEKYFNYWEEYVRARPPICSMLPEGSDLYLDKTVEHLNRPVGAVVAYPDGVYPPAEAILKKALAAAGKGSLPEFAERVRFLQAGLEHARLSARIHEYLDYKGSVQGTTPTNPEKLRKAQQAMKELIEFRHAHQDIYVADYLAAANTEMGMILNAPALFPENAGMVEKELAFQKRWPDKETRDPQAAGLKLVGQHPLPQGDWLFRKDIKAEGDLAEWHLPKADDKEWQKADIGRFWDYFLGETYVGIGWYRRQFDVPKRVEGMKVYLQFGAVDESCWVWVNGTYVGSNNIGPEAWDKPFRLEITPALKPENNLVVVRVQNIAFAGGIWQPVSMEIYEPISTQK